MAKGQKVILLSIVLTGLLVVIAAIIPLTLTYDTVNSWDVTCKSSTPAPYVPHLLISICLGNYSLIGAWSVVETNVGLFCASIIAIRPLLRQLFPTWLALPISSYPGRSSGYIRDNRNHDRKLSHLTNTLDIELVYNPRDPVRGIKSAAWSGHFRPSGSLSSLISDDPKRVATGGEIVKVTT